VQSVTCAQVVANGCLICIYRDAINICPKLHPFAPIVTANMAQQTATIFAPITHPCPHPTCYGPCITSTSLFVIYTLCWETLSNTSFRCIIWLEEFILGFCFGFSFLASPIELGWLSFALPSSHLCILLHVWFACFVLITSIQVLDHMSWLILYESRTIKWSSVESVYNNG
jgi:hypothetical protein